MRTIGIVSPSSPVASLCPRRLARGMAALERIGFATKLGAHASARTGFTAGSPEDRASDIHAMFADPSVDVIMTTIGGYNANEVLERIDYAFIARHPKPFVGYSDTTVLLHALRERSGVPTLLGPMLLPQFGEFPDCRPFTRQSFLRALDGLGSGETYELPVSDRWADEFLSWDEEDDRPREDEANAGWRVLREGDASGPLSGGNLRCLLTLAGTPFQPDLRGTVLCLEDTGSQIPDSLQRDLTHARQAGYFAGVRAVLFGRFQEASGLSGSDLCLVVADALRGLDVPMLADLDFGHTDPMLTLPLGATTHVRARAAGSSVRLALSC